MTGRKDDDKKARAGLMLKDFRRALCAVADVTTFGAAKYSPSNWLQVKDGEDRYFDAAIRHLLAEGRDAESGQLHLAHAAWNILAVLQLRLSRMAPVDAGPELGVRNAPHGIKEVLE